MGFKIGSLSWNRKRALFKSKQLIKKLYFNDIFRYNLFGVGTKFKTSIVRRLELTTFSLYYTKNIPLVVYTARTFKKLVKTLNIIFSQINNVNSTVREIKKLNIIRKYLI